MHRLITQGTIEERIAQLLQRKRALADAVLGGGEAALTELGDDELRDLVTLRADAARAGVTTTVVHPRVAGPPRRGPGHHAGGARRGCARSRRRRTPQPTCAPPAALARSGRIGQISVEAGGFVAAVEDERRPVGGARAPSRCSTPRAPSALVETVAAEAGRVGGAARPATCRTPWSSTPRRPASSCCPTAASSPRRAPAQAWTDPCPHALAVLYQLAWLVEADPFVLLHLRGLARDDLLARLHERGARPRRAGRATPTSDIAARRPALTGGPAAARPSSERSVVVVRGRPVGEDAPRRPRRPSRLGQLAGASALERPRPGPRSGSYSPVIGVLGKSSRSSSLNIAWRPRIHSVVARGRRPCPGQAGSAALAGSSHGHLTSVGVAGAQHGDEGPGWLAGHPDRARLAAVVVGAG